MTEAVRNGLLAIDMPRGKGRGLDQKMEAGHSFRATLESHPDRAVAGSIRDGGGDEPRQHPLLGKLADRAASASEPSARGIENALDRYLAALSARGRDANTVKMAMPDVVDCRFHGQEPETGVNTKPVDCRLGDPDAIERRLVDCDIKEGATAKPKADSEFDAPPPAKLVDCTLETPPPDDPPIDCRLEKAEPPKPDLVDCEPDTAIVDVDAAPDDMDVVDCAIDPGKDAASTDATATGGMPQQVAASADIKIVNEEAGHSSAVMPAAARMPTEGPAVERGNRKAGPAVADTRRAPEAAQRDSAAPRDRIAAQGLAAADGDAPAQEPVRSGFLSGGSDDPGAGRQKTGGETVTRLADSAAGKVTVVSAQTSPASVAPPSPGITTAALVSAISEDPGVQSFVSAPVDAAEPVNNGRNAPVHSLKIQLNPAELGTVTANLRMAGEQLEIEIKVSTPEAHRHLSSDADTIVRAMRSLGYDVDRVTVTQQFSAANGQAGGNGGRDGAFAMLGGGERQSHGAGGRDGGDARPQGNGKSDGQVRQDSARGGVYI